MPWEKNLFSFETLQKEDTVDDDHDKLEEWIFPHFDRHFYQNLIHANLQFKILPEFQEHKKKVQYDSLENFLCNY